MIEKNKFLVQFHHITLVEIIFYPCHYCYFCASARKYLCITQHIPGDVINDDIPEHGDDDTVAGACALHNERNNVDRAIPTGISRFGKRVDVGG